MKTKVFIIILWSIFFSSCTHPDLAGFHHGGGEIAFFQFTDTNLINKAILCFDKEVPLRAEYVHSFGKCWVPLYPKNLEEQPIFGKNGYLGTNHLLNWKIGAVYTLEDLVNSPKYIALKGGYYTCYPFVELESFGCYVNAEWNDLLTLDADTVKIYTSKPYAKRYVIHEEELVRLTKKSTMHFRGWSSDMITIEDVVDVLNKLIETNTIEEHCYVSQRYCE